MKRINKILTIVLTTTLLITIMPLSTLAALTVNSDVTTPIINENGNPIRTFRDNLGTDADWTTNNFEPPQEFGFRIKETTKTTYSIAGGGATNRPGGTQHTNGLNWSKSRDQTLNGNYYIFKITGSTQAQTLGMNAKNLRIYDPAVGENVDVDMEVKLWNWTFQSGNSATNGPGKGSAHSSNAYVYLQYDTPRPNIAIAGLTEVQVDYKFFRAGTSTRYTVKSDYTFADIDHYQYVAVNTSTSGIRQQFVSPISRLRFTQDGDHSIFYAGDTGGNIVDINRRYAMGAIYQSSRLLFRFGSRANTVDGNWGFFGFHAARMAQAVKMPAPTKTSNRDIINPMTTLSQTVRYDVTQMIPAGLENVAGRGRLRGLILRDVLPAGLVADVSSVAVLVNGTNYAANGFTVTRSMGTNNRQTITATATSAMLSNDVLYTLSGQSVTLRITARINHNIGQTGLSLATLRGFNNLNTLGSSFNTTTGLLTLRNQGQADTRTSADGWVRNRNTGTVTTTARIPVNLTVNHLDNRTNAAIATPTSVQAFIGEPYNHSARTNLTTNTVTGMANGYTYRHVRTTGNAPSGTVGTSDITINHFYDVPLVEASLKKIQIYTAPASEGLPVKLELDKKLIYPAGTTGMTTAPIKVNLYDGSELLESKAFTASTLPTSLGMEVPKENLTKNTNKDYTVKLEEHNVNNIRVTTGAGAIATKGYTSAETTVNATAGTDLELSFTGVVMTERSIGGSMITKTETIKIPTISKVPIMKTGYGFELPLRLEYTNGLGDKLDQTKLAFAFRVPSNLIDDYPVYEESGGEASIPLDLVETNSLLPSDSLATKVKFELPHVNVERKTGALFSDQQVLNGDSHITREVRDGFRRFYVPIWGTKDTRELGNFDVSTISTKSIGVHKINVEIIDQLELKAYMIAHIDSPTIEKDSLLFQPVNLSNPFPDGLPDGWSDDDIDWIKE